MPHESESSPSIVALKFDSHLIVAIQWLSFKLFCCETSSARATRAVLIGSYLSVTEPNRAVLFPESALSLDSRAENRPAARAASVGLRSPVKCAASAR
jgi:hypothetical protein